MRALLRRLLPSLLLITRTVLGVKLAFLRKQISGGPIGEVVESVLGKIFCDLTGAHKNQDEKNGGGR